ncbi:protein serine/threonine phosphatase [Aureococcus anophagefferens]|nr:protein serine/threonine phosphatase [Aureococcus anophagefferens]
MDPEMTREKYPCSWPKGAGNFGELSEKEVKGRINSMKTTTVDLSDGFGSARPSRSGFYPHDRKKANQDSFVIAHNVGHKSHHFFGVFDGHGPTGDACSLFACENIKKIVVEKVKGQSANVPAALTDAYEKANRRLKKSPHDDSLSGTTAICVFSSGRKLYAATPATRAMLGTSLGAVALSHDQTPFSKVERDRIKKCGGRIMSADQVDGIVPYHENWDCKLGEELDDDGDPPRVWNQDLEYPGTAFTRSIGDSLAETLGVIATPEIREHEITADDHVLIIASDGVFEFITNTDCVRIALLYSDPLDSCKALVGEALREAYKRWMKREERTDDITCIVAFIEAPPDAPRKTPKFEAPAPRAAAARPPQRRKSRRGSHSMDSFFGQVEFLHPNAQRAAREATRRARETLDGDIYDLDVLEHMHDAAAAQTAEQERLERAKSSKARRGSMAYLKKAMGDAMRGGQKPPTPSKEAPPAEKAS